MSLLNRKQVRAFILYECQRQRRDAGITRVSKAAIDELEANLRNRIRGLVHCHRGNTNTFDP